MGGLRDIGVEGVGGVGGAGGRWTCFVPAGSAGGCIKRYGLGLGLGLDRIVVGRLVFSGRGD
jgi:hypothetical protein